MPQPIDDDATIRLTGPVPPRGGLKFPADEPRVAAALPRAPVRSPRALALVVAASVLAVVLIGIGGWWFWPATRPAGSVPPLAKPQAARTAPEPVAVVPQIAAASPATGGPAALSSTARGLPGATDTAPDQAEFHFETATEQQILDHVPTTGAAEPTVFRFAPNPRILVLDFASLREQGRMLNRIAALVEKAGLPHDRVLTSFEIAAAIKASGDTAETFYYGHDYDAASVIRFFALADRDNIRLLGEEDQLGRMIRQAGWFEPSAQAALISIPQVGADAHVTRAARATILHHELSHGEYFTNPDYVAFVHRFWTQTLSASERDRIRRHLRSVGYDQGLDEVMENEAQAYLMFTEGAEFFTPEMIGMSQARLAELRNGFFRTMPAGWLHDSLGRTLSLGQSVVGRP
ncbi:MAG TPA: hypothetical protein VHX39_12430 [Acetobacteraceae bacterium]|nr:hypothetical protein [Acetobacteraceae bacterium]